MDDKDLVETLHVRVEMLERIVSLMETQLAETNLQLKYALMPKTILPSSTEALNVLYNCLETNINAQSLDYIQGIFENTYPAYTAIANFIQHLIGDNCVTVKGQQITFREDSVSTKSVSVQTFADIVCTYVFKHCHPIIQRLSESAEGSIDENGDDVDNNRINNIILLKTKTHILKIGKLLATSLRRK